MKAHRVATLLLACVAAACGNNIDTRDAARPGCVENFDSAVDYFPATAEVESANNFRVTYHDHYKVVQSLRSSEDTAPLEYILVLCGTPVPADLPSGAIVITIPLASVFLDSVAHVGLLEELERTDVVQGIAEGRYLTGDALLKRFAAGEIVEYGRNETVDAELIIATKPSAVFTSGFNDGAYATVPKAGVPVIANVSWLETNPLGRAEWLKFMALFLNEEQKANERFATIRDNYLRLKTAAEAIAPADRVTVTTGTSFRGIYTVAGGKSYAAALIADAGGNYLWSDNNDAGSATVDIEEQIHRAADADIWVNGGDWKSLDDMLAEDHRYAQFKAFRDRQVWIYNLRETPSGANDYWLRGVARPDLVLADLQKIFYPHLAEPHEFVWYRRLEPRNK